ncbi:MAG: InlB B-repeat-containing protein [Coriobacteriia bacterium]|nr:InlB B-repeat-containing protein [Coriobacteriia bacterium]
MNSTRRTKAIVAVLSLLVLSCLLLLPLSAFAAEGSYTITFDSQGGSATSPRTIVAGQPIGTLPTPTKTGNTFNGWTKGAAAGSGAITAAFVPTEDMTIYAQWTGNSYTITFNNEGSIETRSLVYGHPVTPGYTPSKVGYTFLGWYSAASGGVKVETVSQVQTVYARFQINTYSVNYYDGATLLRTVSVNHGSAVIAGPAKTGYTFVGWYTTASGGTAVTTITGSQNLYARYTTVTHIIRFYDGSTLLGSGLVPDGYVLEQIIVPGVDGIAAPDKVGLVFSGWYTAATGGTKVTTATQAQNLYARYVAATYTVRYYDGTTLLQTANVAHNGAVIAGPAKTGYTFAGWFTAASGGSQVTKITAAQNLYARYTAKSYNLSYYDGTKLIKKVSKSYGASLTDATTYANAPKKAGKTFIGWYSSATSGSQVMTMPAKDVSIYARYQDAKYLVRYYDHNKVLYKQTATALYDSNVISGPARTGYTFTGWYMSNGTKITKIRADRDLYAKYTVNKYNLSYYDGTKLIKKVSKSFGASLTDATTYANAPKKAGKTFIGWYSSATGGSQVMTMPAKDVKIYARYQDIKYRVRYYDHNKVLYKQTATASYDSNVISGPARTGYTFTGWYMSNGTKITKIRADRDLYAKYTINKYTVEYFDGTKLIKKVSKSYGASLTDATTYANAPVKAGKTFIGWYSSATGGAQVLNVPAKNVKLYARYK